MELCGAILNWLVGVFTANIKSSVTDKLKELSSKHRKLAILLTAVLLIGSVSFQLWSRKIQRLESQEKQQQLVDKAAEKWKIESLDQIAKASDAAWTMVKRCDDEKRGILNMANERLKAQGLPPVYELGGIK